MPELSEIVGQAGPLEQLAQAVRADRMPHAFLFVGPTGVGRRTTATALAKTLLCQAPTASGQLTQACCQCDDCTMFAAGTHPDFALIYKELARYHEDAKVRERKMQDLSIGVIRSFLIAPAQRAPTCGRGKMFVVLGSELMSEPAQNALLKTLEEPPSGVTIILISRNADQMLPTTVSRCCIVRFGPLPAEFVAERLQSAGAGPAEAAFWAAFTEGSIGDALRFSAQGLYELKCQMIDQLASPAAAGQVELGAYLVEQADKLAGSYVKAAKEADGAELSKLLASRQAAGVMLRLIASAFADAMGESSGSDLPRANADQPEAVATLAGRFDKAQLAEILQQLATFEGLLWRNVNPKTVWDNVAITCRWAAPLRI